MARSPSVGGRFGRYMHLKTGRDVTLRTAAIIMEEAPSPEDLVPVTVLTGFLGSGKTTLLNHILTGSHGKRFAVIENEFGEVGVDDALIKSRFKAEEDIFEMNNGCICCTVRVDLITILTKLMRRKNEGSKLDGIIIETTGLADPAPVAQTFFVDENIRSFARLDAIVTLVDAKHIEEHLDEQKPEGVENEAVEQVAFADVILLNKIDLVPDEKDLARVEARLKGLNQYAPILRCKDSSVALEALLNIRDLAGGAAQRSPDHRRSRTTYPDRAGRRDRGGGGSPRGAGRLLVCWQAV